MILPFGAHRSWVGQNKVNKVITNYYVLNAVKKTNRMLSQRRRACHQGRPWLRWRLFCFWLLTVSIWCSGLTWFVLKFCFIYKNSVIMMLLEVWNIHFSFLREKIVNIFSSFMKTTVFCLLLFFPSRFLYL